MNPLFEAGLAIEQFCRSRSWRFCFIGGLAVLRWGEPRLTHDLDLTVLTGFGGEELYVRDLFLSFEARIDDAAAFALRNRVVLMRSANGIPVDIALGALPFEEHAVHRATPYEIGAGRSLLTCSAEDLVVHKAFAGRDRDWLDIEGVIVRRGRHMDWDLVLSELRPLLDVRGERSAEERLRGLRERAPG
ncbi:MAG: hypothetical protein ACRDWW_04035 [Acidimicrobiales bacterium]